MHPAALFTEFAVTAPAAFAWLTSHCQSFASSASSALVTSVWQGAVIVSVLEIVTRLMPRVSAAHRFVLWSAGFVLSLALPLLPLIDYSAGSLPSLAAGSAIVRASSHARLQLDDRWGFVIATLWLLAGLIRAANLAVDSTRLRRLWKAARPIEIDESLASSLSNIGVGRVAVCTTQLLDRPSVIGFFTPRILLPDWLLSRLTPVELRQIVLHEAEHLRRRDDWTNLIQKLCLVVFPINPALAWIEHHLCREREMACDEGVIRITNAPRAYAACLASLAERRLERRAEALSLGAWHRRSELTQRVHRILVHKSMMSRTAAGALLAILGSALVAGSLEMSRFPQLVAFVPRHNSQAMTAARQVQLDALLARENSVAKLVPSPLYRAVPAKAVLPVAQPSVPARVSKRASSTSSDVKQMVRSAAPAQQIVSADRSGDRVISAQPPLPQHWVVITAWEEVSTVSRAPQTISDFETGLNDEKTSDTTSGAQKAPSATASAPAESDRNHSSQPVGVHHSTVTQLILRVVPANPNSSSTQPAAVPVRDGWFVIQL